MMMLLRNNVFCLFAALIAGAVLPLAFAPFHIFIAALLAPAMLAFIWRNRSKTFAAIAGFCFGLGLFGIGTSWIFVSVHQFSDTPFSIAILITLLFVMILAGFIALQGWFYARFIPSTSYRTLLLAFPSTWVLFEWLRSWLFSGFPWLYLGYSQMDTPLAGYAPILGVYGVSWLCAFSGVLILSYFLYPKRYLLTSLLLITIWAGGFGLQQINWTHTTGDPVRVALLQGNIDQNLKWNAKTREFIMHRYEILSAQARNVDTIIWPEASLPVPLPAGAPLLEKLKTELENHHQNALIGLVVEQPDGRFYNGIEAIGPNAEGVYYKRHLVPFGEFVPFEKMLRGLVGFFDLPMSYGLPGPAHQEALIAGPLRFAALICYEIVYPSLTLHSLDDTNILLTISNDSWFGQSIGPHQHFQMARMRALELGRYLIRSTNSGITAITDQKGHVIAQAPQFVATTLIGEVFAVEGKTPLSFLTHYFVLVLSSLFLLYSHGTSRCKPPQSAKAKPFY
jgi:apolipoprotein N-acyltransferase